jgi:hypothetical protein
MAIRWSGLLVSVAVAAASACAWPDREPRARQVGFWFEPVGYESPRLGGALTADELATIARVARGQLVGAFSGFNVVISDRRDAPYRVRVVQDLRDQRMERDAWIAGEARAVSFGGTGAVNFLFLANGAMVYAPDDATRDELVHAIGRGIGRAAAHELAHALLPKADIHDTRDRRSYEYESAARVEQYFGDMRWDVAAPLLQERVGRVRPDAGSLASGSR